MTRWIKHVLGWLLARSDLHRPLLRDHAVIVVFHRVDDRLGGDPISCTRAQFRQWCRFFSRYLRVVSLTELLDSLRRGEDITGRVAITFDDGYLDNIRNAAPELSKLDLPACFFITTDFIESNAVPAWDEHLPMRPDWMVWNDVRALAKQGFEIGAHTMTHVDLGLVDAEVAEREIAGSRKRLEQELGRPVLHFSYPFGRREQITAGSRELVKNAGFVSCLSAHGGLVRPGDDPHNIERMPMAPWFVSPYHFLFELIRQAR